MTTEKGTDMTTAGEQQTETITVKIPKCFIEDHRARDLKRRRHAYLQHFYGQRYVAIRSHELLQSIDTTVVHESKEHYTVTLTRRQAAELLSDADYYIELGVDGLGSEYLGLVSSARATRNALLKAGA